MVSGVATGEQYVYTWDYRNRLTEVRIKDAAADTTYDRGYKFIYDDQNRLAVKQGDLDGDGDYDEHGDSATFLWDGQNMTVLTPGGQIMSQIYGPQTDQLLFVRETNETFLPLADHLNTVRDVVAARFDGTNAYNAVHVEHNRYDSFGRVIEREQFDGTSWNVTTDPSYVQVGYTGKYFDISIGAQFNINRWYDAEVGRWISEDPIGFAGGDVNLGRYVGNASVIYVDPNGLFSSTNHDKITKYAFIDTDLSEASVKIIILANRNQDAGAWRNGGPFGDPINHGDDNKIVETIKRMISWRKEFTECQDCSDPEKVREMLRTFGKFAHALQDLYSHSNYIENYQSKLKPNEREEGMVSERIPLWQMWDDKFQPIADKNIISGNYSWPTDLGTAPAHRYLNKDSDDKSSSPKGAMASPSGVTYHDLAFDLAKRHTLIAWNDFYSNLHPNCKAAFDKEVMFNPAIHIAK